MLMQILILFLVIFNMCKQLLTCDFNILETRCQANHKAAFITDKAFCGPNGDV